MSKKILRVVVCAQHLPDSYSGGRYHAWIMGEALAAAGHDVTVWTNCRPFVTRDFKTFEHHGRIKLCIDHESGPPNTPDPCDVLIIVPHGRHDFRMYGRALLYAHRTGCRVALLNFESPNWFNAYSPEPRPVSQWDHWVMVSRYSDLILSSTREGQSWAEQFYIEAPPSTVHRFCYPAINTPVADAVPEGPRQKRVVCMTRFFKGHLHKGAMDLLLVLPELRGYELHLIVNPNNLRHGCLDPLEAESEARGVTLVLHTRLTDREKFSLLRSAQGMLFLSHFEGYGYPPVEALYCGAPCVSYELPVLREVSGDALATAPKNDGPRLSKQVRAMLEQRVPIDVSERIAHVASFDRYAHELDVMFQELVEESRHPAAIAALDAQTREAMLGEIGTDSPAGLRSGMVRRFVDWSRQRLADTLGSWGR